MSNETRDPIALLSEQHLAGLWDDLPILETLTPALLADLPARDAADQLARLRAEGVAPATIKQIEQNLFYQRLIEQLSVLLGRLRQAGLPLGPEEFYLLLDALRKGLGGSDRATLKRLCRLLWLNDQNDETLFDHFFETTILVAFPSATSAAPGDTDATGEASDTADEGAADEQPPLVKSRIVDNKDDQRQPLAQPLLAPDLPTEKEVEVLKKHFPADEAALLSLNVQDTEIAYRQFMETTDYFPVTRRRLKQNWRYLRRMVRSGAAEEIDVQATVNRIAAEGFLLEPVLRPRRVNRAALLLLIDRQGSMVPFHGMGRRIVETAVESGRLGQIETYYFHNVPPQHPHSAALPASSLYRQHNLFQSPNCVQAVPVEKILDHFDPIYTSVLIFSDAGAARGGWNETRIQNTARFLYQLQQLGLEDVAWLNPMPRERWGERQENSAAEIAQLVPMFSMDTASLFAAINTLRGRALRHMT